MESEAFRPWTYEEIAARPGFSLDLWAFLKDENALDASALLPPGEIAAEIVERRLPVGRVEARNHALKVPGLAPSEYGGVAVLRDVVQLLLYALLAAFSPLALAATMTAIGAGRRQALGLGVGFVAGQLVACVLFVVLDFTAVGSSRRSYPGIRAPLALALAIVLVWLASRVRRKPPPVSESKSRAHALLARLSRLGYLTTLAVGLLLGIGGPKRLVLTALAAALIATAGAGDSAQAELIVVYVALATALVWGPVVFYVVRGEKAVALMKAAQERASRHQPAVTIYALRGLAALLFIDAIGVLLVQGV